MPKPRTTYIAFLRGINVGGNKTVSMADLRAAFIELGYSKVSTYINSGNVIFQSPKSRAAVEKEVERTLAKDFGFPIKAVIRDAENIQKLCKAIPPEWKNDTEQKTDVLFLWDAFDKKSTLGAIATHPAVDRLMYVKGAIIWNIQRSDYSKSGMHAFIGTEVYKNMTGRNVNTVRKLEVLMRPKISEK